MRGPLSGASFEWISVGPSPNPRERWSLGRRAVGANPSGQAAAMTAVSLPVPRTKLRLSVLRPVGMLSPRGLGGPMRGAFIGGKF